MPTTVHDLVDKTRSMVWGGQGDPLAILGEDYIVGQGQVTLSTQMPGATTGSLLSVGLNTFYVLSQGSDRRSFSVIAKADGGPEEDVPAGSIVRVRPKATNWSIFREIHDGIVDMASPRTGLFQPMSFEASPTYNGDLYPLPALWWEAAVQPQRMVRARWKRRGRNEWLPLHSAEWYVERYAVRVLFEPADVSMYEFTFGFPYLSPTSLDDELFDLGLTEKSTQDIPPLRAAARMSIGMEGRRAQPYSQGDSRRPEEVPMTASTSVAREFNREYREAIMAERSRLQALFEFQARLGDEP